MDFVKLKKNCISFLEFLVQQHIIQRSKQSSLLELELTYCHIYR